jgi:hypothetical protein
MRFCSFLACLPSCPTDSTVKRKRPGRWPGIVSQRSHTWLLLALALPAAGPIGAAGASFALRPGDLYINIDGGVEELTPQLSPVATLTFSGVTVTEGLAFTPQGHLVFSAYKGPDSSSRTQHVLEIGPTGTLLHDLDLGFGSLDRGCEAAVDPSGNIYVSTTPNIVEIAPDFSSSHTLSYSFQRSAGVAVAPNGRIYTSDAQANRIVYFDATGRYLSYFAMANYPAGLAFAPDGRLAICQFLSGSVLKLNLQTGVTSTLLSSVPNVEDITFNADSSFYASYNYGHTISAYDASGNLVNSISTGNFSDSFAIAPVPEPATDVLVTLAAMMGMWVGWRQTEDGGPRTEGEGEG